MNTAINASMKNDGLKNGARWFFFSLIVVGAYFIFGKLGLQLASIQPNATPVWVPTGIAIAALFILGRRIWPAIFIGAFLTNLLTAGTLITSLGIAAGNTLEAVAAVYLINRFTSSKDIFDRPIDIFRFCVCAGILGPAISATVGVTSLALAGFAPWANYSNIWLTWWLGDLGGTLIIAPVIILWSLNAKITWNFNNVSKIIYLIALLAVAAFASFTLSSGFVYFLAPLFIWGAFQFRQREIATAVFVLTEVFLWGTLHGLGPFVQNTTTLNEALIVLQVSMATTFITVMILTAIVVEERKATMALSTINEKINAEKAVDAAIIASVGEGLIVTDKSGTIVLANPQAETLLGKTSDELVGRQYHEAVPMKNEEGDVIPLKDRPIYQVTFEGKQVASNPLGPTQYYVRKDGTSFPVFYTKSPVLMDGAAIGAIEVFRDITKGKEIDQAKSDFVSLASHQLRTPLSIISMYSELLFRQGKIAEQHDVAECLEYANEIQEATRRMTDLINDLLNASSIDTQTLTVATRPIDVKKLAESIFDEMAPKIKNKKLRVSKSYAKNIPLLNTDAQLLGIAIQNLVSNAVKYTPPNGTLSLKISMKRSEVTIAISDTGYGIPRQQQSEIFKKLFRADNARMIESEGTGLGLYIAKSIVDKLGGEISFLSKENKGSTFWLTFPLEHLMIPAAAPGISTLTSAIYEES